MDQILFNEKCRSGLDGGALDYSSQLKVSIRVKINPIMGTFSRNSWKVFLLHINC